MSSSVVFVTRYDVIVHARNVHAGLGTPVTVYAANAQGAVNEAVAVGWRGHSGDARVTIKKVTQEPVVVPPAAGASA